MGDKINIWFLMVLLTLVNLLFLTVFFLVISSDKKTKTTIDNIIEKNFDGKTKNQTEQADQEETASNVLRIITQSDYEGTMDDSYIEILKERLIGNYYVSDTIWFDFEPDGVFNGFFDYEFPNISNGFYEVVMNDDIPTLYIYNEERVSMVSYTLILNQRNVVLRYELANINFELKN